MTSHRHPSVTLRLLAALLLAAPLATRAEQPPLPSRPDFSMYKTATDLFFDYKLPKEPGHEGKEDRDSVWSQTLRWYMNDEICRRCPVDQGSYDDQFYAWQARVHSINCLMGLARNGRPGLSLEQGIILKRAVLAMPGMPVTLRNANYGYIIGDLVSYGGTTAAVAEAVRFYQHECGDLSDCNSDTLIQATEKLKSSEPELVVQMQAALEKIHSAQEKMAAEKENWVTGLQANQQAKMAPLLNKPFEFKFTALDGAEVDVAKLRGKVVLVDLWATWCGPCVEDIPRLAAAYKKYHERGLEIIGGCLDEGDDAKNRARLLDFARKHDMTWPQFFDGKGFQGDFGQRYGVYGIPEILLVNKQGDLVDYKGREDLEAKLEKLLAD